MRYMYIFYFVNNIIGTVQGDQENRTLIVYIIDINWTCIWCIDLCGLLWRVVLLNICELLKLHDLQNPHPHRIRSCNTNVASKQTHFLRLLQWFKTNTKALDTCLSQWLGMGHGQGHGVTLSTRSRNREQRETVAYSIYGHPSSCLVVQQTRDLTECPSHARSIPSPQYYAPADSYVVHLQYYAYIYIYYVYACLHTYNINVCRRVGYLACASRAFRFYRVFAYLVYGWLVCSSLVDLFFFFALLKHRVVQIINILNLWWWPEPETRVLASPATITIAITRR